MTNEGGKNRVVGTNFPKLEARAKATGEHKYPSDIYLPNMLYCKVLRSPYAHALVRGIDTAKAKQLPGVKGVITHEDSKTPCMTAYFFLPSALTRDRHILEQEVRYVGDRVVAVAATSPEIAEEALNLIEVEYEELPAVFDAIQAMQPGAPAVHRVIMQGDVEVQVKNNSVPIRIDVGDVEEGFKQADLVVEKEFRTQRVHQTPMERKSVVCQPLPGGGIEIWTQTQSIYGFQMDLSVSLSIPVNKIKVHRIFPGGSFGLHMLLGFLDPIVALLALKTGMPVRGEETREEMFLWSGRHPQVITLKIGAKNDGALTAMDMEIVDNTGAYGGAEDILPIEGGFFMSMYRCPNMRYNAYSVYTNTMPLGPMRGVGNPEQNFTVEQVMDILAEELGIDPLKLRLKNHVRKGDKFYGQGPDIHTVVQSCGTEQLINEGAKLIGWENRKSITPYKDKPWIKRGIGMARGFHTTGAASNDPSSLMMDYSEAIVKMSVDGTANLITAFADTGCGGLSAHAAMVAEELGLRYEDVNLVETDTSNVPYDVGTHASRAVYNQGLAVVEASAKVKKVILDWAAKILQVPVDELELRDRQLYQTSNPSKNISIQEVLVSAQYRNWGTAIGTASVRAPVCPPHFTVTFVEVDVDTQTGEVKVLRAVSGADVGVAINPNAVIGQVVGGLHMGVGYSLTEATLTDPIDGHVLNPNFRDYKLLTPLDMPKVEIIFANTYESTGPYGAKGIGEGATNPVASAVANAIYNAVGIRTYSLPITPEKILKALKEKRKY